MSTTPDTNSASSLNPTPAPRPRGKRWLKVVIALVVILLLLVLLLPTLLSTGPGNSILLSQINSRAPGKIHAEKISVGWFSGATVHKFKYDDEKGKTVVTADDIVTPITVWDAIVGSTIDAKGLKVSGAGIPDRPGVVVQVNLVGTIDLGKKVLNFTGDSSITATDPKSPNVTKIDIPAGSVASWGDLANDIRAVVTYHLPDIQPLIASSLPKDAVLEGSHSMPIHIVGKLTKDKGLRAIRGFKIDQTTLGEGRIYMEGFDLGAAQIPYHMDNGILTIVPTEIAFREGGRIRVRGKIDFNADPPAFIIDTPDDAREPFIKDLPLNHKIAAGKLRFFPLLWGSIDQAGNLGEVSGKVSVKLDSVYVPLDAEAFKRKGTVAGVISIRGLSTEMPFLREITKALGPVAGFGGKDMLAIRGGDIPDVPFNMANGKVSYSNLRLGTSSLNLTFSGSVGLDNSLAMNMDFATRGLNVPVPVVIKGTTKKPEIALSGKMPKLDAKDLGGAIKDAPNMLDNLLKKKETPKR